MPSIPPYFRAMYPDQAKALDEGYTELGNQITKGIKNLFKRFNPFRTP